MKVSMMKRSGEFWLGEIIDTFQYDFDGERLHVRKFHPWKRDGCSVRTGDADPTQVKYNCEEISECFGSLFLLVVAWIAYKRLGSNQHALVDGIGRALRLDVTP